MTCERCGTEGAKDTILSWEITSKDWEDAPSHRLCDLCVEVLANKYVADHPIDPNGPWDCPGCKMTIRRGDAQTLFKKTGACLLCPACVARGQFPWEKDHAASN